MIWSWKLKLRIENGNATEKLQDKNLQAPQAAYNQIKLLHALIIERKNILYHLKNIF